MSNTIRISFVILIILLCLSGSSLAVTDDTYINERFGYSVLLPPSFFWDGESDSGDGQKFVSPDGKVEVLVYGRNNVLEESASVLYEKALISRTGIKTKHADSFGYKLEGIEDGRGFIEQVLLNEEAIISCVVKYPESQEKEFKPISDSIVKSFTFTQQAPNSASSSSEPYINSSREQAKEPDQVLAKVKASQPPPLDRSRFTLAFVFESFCHKTDWRCFTSKAGQNIVECSGSAREEFLKPGVKLNFCIQFEVIPDLPTPKVVYLELNGEKQPPAASLQLYMWAMGAAMQREATNAIPDKVE